MTETVISQQNNQQEELTPDASKEIIEAVLFAAGHQMTYEVLGKVLGIGTKEAKKLATEYAAEYNGGPTVPRGVMMLIFDDCCQLCTKKEYINYIRDALGIRKNGTLSASSLETLAIIAYNQPVTRTYVDTVRGVDSSYAIGSLLDRGLIECKGRLDAPGRPMLYGTGTDFLRCFGFDSLADLPGADSEEIAELFARIEGHTNAAKPNVLEQEQIQIEETSAETTSEN